MKKTAFIFFFGIFFLAKTIMAGTLALSNFSGQKGPAPPPAPYATTTLSLHDASVPIGHFYLEIWFFDGEPENYALSLYQIKMNSTVFDGWDFLKNKTISGTGQSYIVIEGWTTGSPIPKGTTIDLAHITFEVKQEIEAVSVFIKNSQYDFEGFQTKDATFTPGAGVPAEPFVPHIYGDINLDGVLDLKDVLIIMEKLTKQ